MPRPTKFRRVEFFPDKTEFYPEGVTTIDDMEECKQIVLKFEELEAMRLKDIEGLNQEECAGRMEVSRQTFQNIIDSARQKVTMALTKGYAIKIAGGNFVNKNCRYICKECGSTYELGVESDRNSCPNCNSTRVGCKNRRRMCNRCR